MLAPVQVYLRRVPADLESCPGSDQLSEVARKSPSSRWTGPFSQACKSAL